MSAGETFRALLLEQDENGATRAGIRDLSERELPAGEVLVEVTHSSLNYKDGLAVTGKGKVVRNWPMVPGIDLAGRVRESSSPEWQPGDGVLLTGWGIGERYWGGYSQLQRVRARWLVPLPAGLDARDAMTLGTAGFTAMLCVMTLEEAGVMPDAGPVVVTGASGGVGCIATAVLARLGYEVAAVTGRPEGGDWLRTLGASVIIERAEMAAPARPLERQRWAGAVDCVGGDILARVLAETHHGGTVAACGLAGGHELHTSVMPFILRGIGLRGVESVTCPRERRLRAWERLARELPLELLEEIRREATLEEVPRLAEAILAGRVRGRVVIDLRTSG